MSGKPEKQVRPPPAQHEPARNTLQTTSDRHEFTINSNEKNINTVTPTLRREEGREGGREEQEDRRGMRKKMRKKMRKTRLYG